MATIDLNNLIRPKKVNSPTTVVTEQVQKEMPVYVDLHLDFDFAKSIGIGNDSVDSRDIKTDTDINAIKNSIKNIFTTKKGEKVLNPTFGSSLEQYLFEAVSESRAKAIGDDVYTAITTFEPRVDVIKVYVQPQPYSTKNINFDGTNLTVYEKNKIKANPNEISEVGPGYSISVIYQIKEIKVNNVLNIIAQIGGQILI